MLAAAHKLHLLGQPFVYLDGLDDTYLLSILPH
jgi:hypothetical protein